MQAPVFEGQVQNTEQQYPEEGLAVTVSCHASYLAALRLLVLHIRR